MNPRLYEDVDVLTRARERVRQCYDEYDVVIVSFSGGKDSLVVLELAREVCEERGQKVKAVFRDEELIPTSVVEFVEKFMHYDWVDLEWHAPPIQSHRMTLGIIEEYIQWDPLRGLGTAPDGIGHMWMRDKPEWALTADDLGMEPGEVSSQYNANPLMFRDYPGQSCMSLVGVRAAESLTRMMAACSSVGPQYWLNSKQHLWDNCNTIVDWEENDIFRYMWDKGIEYCTHYNDEMWTGSEFRVASLITSEASRNLDDLRAQDPAVYDRIIQIFPEVATQARYSSEWKGAPIPDTWGEVLDWVDGNLAGDWADRANRMIFYMQRRGAEIGDCWPLLQKGGYKQSTSAFSTIVNLNRKKEAAEAKALAEAGEA